MSRKPNKRKLPRPPGSGHTIVRELEELRRDQDRLERAREIAERDRDRAKENADRIKASCVATVGEYKKRLDALLAFVRKEAPGLFMKWMDREIK